MTNVIDNTKLLKGMMDFSDPEKFYYLQLLRRSKDGGSKSVKVIKNFYISNEEYFDRKIDTIKDMCDYFGARAYLRMNRRSYKDVAFENLETMTKLIRNGQFEAVMSSFSKSCGRTKKEPNRIWIIDLDFEDVGVSRETSLVNPEDTDKFRKYRSEILMEIRNLHKEVRQRDYSVLGLIPTVNGQHILTNPFNVKKFKEVFGDKSPDIHHDNPTVMYAPEL